MIRLLLVAALTLAAPAAAEAPTGLYGHVTRGPISPVCRVGYPCDAPAKNTKFLLQRAGKGTWVHTTRTGAYRVRLQPGRYLVTTGNHGPGGIKPSSVRVPAGRYLRVNFSIDTGIR
jgi:hypothetical protein